jgi:hypothetical protein
MTVPSLLTGSHLRTHNTIFQHPAAHNLAWHDVHALFRHLGTVEEQPNGNLKVTRHGQSLILHQARTKDVATTEELMALRHFLTQTDVSSPPAPVSGEAHWLLVINHRDARIYRTEMRGTTPERIMPHEPDDFFRHAPHSKDFSRGKEKPDPNSFFEPVAKALQAADRILIFGRGTGMSSEMDQFVAWTKDHHPLLAQRIIGQRVIDESQLTEAQLLAHAREFYAQLCPN